MILDRFRVTGRVAVVTGAGRGIGAATAIALAQAGADVVISARTGDQLAGVAREVEAAGLRARSWCPPTWPSRTRPRGWPPPRPTRSAGWTSW